MDQIEAGAPLAAASRQDARSKTRRLIWPTFASAIALAILLALGFWQIRRLAWKETLLARIHDRMRGPPEPLPPESDWATLKPGRYEYRHVKATGVFDNDKEVQVYIGSGGKRYEGVGPGYDVLTPLRLPDGAHVIVNRGFVPLANKNPATRADGEPRGTVTVAGVMRPPQGRNFFTPPDKPAEGVWFTRDPAAIAAYFHLARTAPFLINADRNAAAPQGAPAGGATVVDIPNNHFMYAVTWFGLAAGLMAVYGVFAMQIIGEK